MTLEQFEDRLRRRVDGFFIDYKQRSLEQAEYPYPQEQSQRDWYEYFLDFQVDD